MRLQQTLARKIFIKVAGTPREKKSPQTNDAEIEMTNNQTQPLEYLLHLVRFQDAAL